VAGIEKREIGRTGLSVTALGFGGVGLGQKAEAARATISEAEAEATVRAALAAGVKYFDTSPWYGHGLSEHRTGHVLRTLPRERFVLSTKVGRVFFRPENPGTYKTISWADGLPFDYRFDYTADGIRPRSADTSEPAWLNRKMLSMKRSTSCFSTSRKYSATVSPERPTRRRAPGGSFI